MPSDVQGNIGGIKHDHHYRAIYQPERQSALDRLGRPDWMVSPAWLGKLLDARSRIHASMGLAVQVLT